MTPDDLKKIANKIAKCLALASSDNPAEAEAAKRQADALMQKYNLTSGDVAAANVHDETVDTGAAFKLPPYLGDLSVIIAKAFGCGVVCELGFINIHTQVRFFGLGIKPELAAYTYDVLRRHVQRDRAAFNAGQSSRLKRATKIRRADLFCQAWVQRIAKQVNEFAGNEAERQAIAAFKQQKYGDMLSDDTRPGASTKHGNDWQASAAGYQAAADVSLHKPVQAKRGALLGVSP
ncbi:DUF2786 domain-containing protein [Methylomonas sp. EFPC3]|uniref:DUF2786 domain-containing protein n=1 Tax=Methylomonas sp. EFPC3 TaxID=3021710 RepID=UPI002415DB28|nr:DUF2786 domain-containing protein [Methylomonas sp. EFPC3]WFP51400.1 DUF2786 domain-containing protein [Methylomonas sp. EFPC3]